MDWTYIKWRCQKATKRRWQSVCKKIYVDRDRDIKKTVMVAGTARSGTTWLADIIASQLPSRIMFEPFQPRLVEEMRSFHYFQYIRPDEDNAELRSFCKRVFSGNIRHPWIDRQVSHVLPKLRVIKDIRANLFLKWLNQAFPEIPLLFILRHPCAVVASRMQLGWATDSDITPFLAQPKLIEDFLSDKLDLIKSAVTAEEKHAIIWCVSNLVPLKQFQEAQLKIVFYENLCTQPKLEIPVIFNAIKRDYAKSVYERMSKPSLTSLANSAVSTNQAKLNRWQEYLNSKQIDRILSVVEGFGLDYLYDRSALPLCLKFKQKVVNEA